MTGTPEQITGGEALVQSLLDHGTDTVFLIPGIQLDWAVDAMGQCADIRMIVPRHEQSVSYMADGYARVSGRTGVGMVVPGPGILNAGAGLATAYACNSPVVMIVGHIHGNSIGKGFGNLHELRDQSSVLEGITKWNALIASRDSLPGVLADAFAQVTDGRTAPVSVEIPFNLLIEKAAAHPQGTPKPANPVRTPDTALLRRAAEALNTAAFPVIYVGGGTRHAAEALRAFADRCGIPIVNSDNARGVLPDSHPMSFTALEGRPLFQKADTVLVIGSRFMEAMSPQPSWPQGGKTWIYANIDAHHFTAPRLPDIGIETDAAAFITALAPLMNRAPALTPQQSQGIKTWARTKIDTLGEIAQYCHALRAALPTDGIFVNELTQVGYLARVAFAVEDPKTYIGPGYQGTLGYSFPTALGAAVGAQGKRVYAITGDGGFGWSSSELATAMRYELPVTLIVFNDGHYGNVRSIQKRVFGRNVVTELRNPDFGKLAAAYDMPFFHADSPATLEVALRQTNALSGPALIEVPLGELNSPWGLLRLTPMPGTGDDGADMAGLV
jgi:acetolactate synthase-1/2/3 large subunit